MEKRILLAIALSLALLVGWSLLMPRLFPEFAKKPEVGKTDTTDTTNKTDTTNTTHKSSSSHTSSTSYPSHTSQPTAPIAAQRVQLTTVSTPEYEAVLSNRGAQLVSFKLRKYTQKNSKAPVDLVKAREAHRTDYPFRIVSSDPAVHHKFNSALYAVTDVNDRGTRVIQYRYSDGTRTATKTFKFPQQPYLFEFATSIVPPVPHRIEVGPGIRTLSPEEQDTQVIITGNGVVQQEGKLEILNREKTGLESYNVFEFIGIEDNYFMTVLRPARGGSGVLWRIEQTNVKTKAARSDLFAGINATSDGAVSGEAFFGPKETKLLDRYGLGEALQFGWFGFIARFFLEALVWINQFTKNYGFAIIVLTIFIKIVLYPLQHKQNVSMKKMQRLNPKVEAIKAKYKKSKTDPEQRQKMNVEVMQLYQKEGVNPMAGCLPMLIQFPVLIAFYNLLSRAIELRGAPWMLWIDDLSEKDPTYILPILMTATMFLQTWMMPATGDPAQRKIFLMMPLVFGFLFKDFPSGLVLYWLVQNVLTIIQQMIMNKWWKDHPTET
jgi:YidC/Oxa1 family membrane protein insertase